MANDATFAGTPLILTATQLQGETGRVLVLQIPTTPLGVGVLP
jgi:hypothetical protein